MTNYRVCYRESWSGSGTWPQTAYDVLLSAYNESDRVKTVFEQSTAASKHWFISPEYGFDAGELPDAENLFVVGQRDEGSAIVDFIAGVVTDPLAATICVDATGFMRHHLLILLRFLKLQGVPRLTVLYSEPSKYAKRDKTVFSDGEVQEVRQIAGFEGIHNPDTSNDLLIIGAGYDHPLIAHAAENKSNARKIQLLGLPSLKADMYQENVVRAYRAAEQIGASVKDEETVFMPAHDPFVTAEIFQQIVVKANREKPITTYISARFRQRHPQWASAFITCRNWMDCMRASSFRIAADTNERRVQASVESGPTSLNFKARRVCSGKVYPLVPRGTAP